MALSDRELFARLINCEAGGEGLDGMKAVATVIMNRVNVSGGEYLRICQGSLRKVILQQRQFTCAMTQVYGQYNSQNIYDITAEKEHYDVADWALSGNKHWGAGESLWYFNPFNPNCSGNFPVNGSGVFFSRVNQHCFYIPTDLYWQT